jgi:hypothetical protein
VTIVITRSEHQSRSYATGTDVRVEKSVHFFCEKTPERKNLLEIRRHKEQDKNKGNRKET